MTFSNTADSRWLFLTPGLRHQWHKVGDGSASSVVMAPLLWIGRNFPEAPPALWQKVPGSSEEERVVDKGEHGGDHLMLELMAQPNAYYSGSILWMATAIDYHLSGNGYWLKIRDRGGRPRELWWVPSSIMTPKGDSKTFISHYEYRPGVEPVDVQPEDVVHFRYSLDHEDPRKGRSPLSSLLQEVFTDQEAADFTAAILGNMGVPGIVISPTNGVSPGRDDVDATKKYFQNAFSGDNRGKPLVMSGPTTVEQFGFSPQQLNLRDIRRIPEERVSGCIGVPAIICGLGAGLDRSTFANYAEAREAGYEDCLIPAQRNLSNDVHTQLLSDFQPDDYFSYRFGFDLSNVRVLQEDRNKLSERFDVGIRGGWIRVSEGRRAMELDIEDSDEIYLRPVNVIEIPAGEAGNAPVQPLLSPGQNGPEQPALPPGSPEEQPPEAQSTPPTSIRGRPKRRVRASRWQTRLMHALILDQHALSSAFTRELEFEFTELGKNCADTYQQMIHHESGSNGHTEKHIKQVDAEILARMITASLLSSFDEKLSKRFEVHTARAMAQTFKTIDSMVNLTGGVSDQVQREIIANGGKRLGLVDLEKQTRESLFRTINEGNQLGIGPIDMARNIRDEVPAGRFVNAGSGYRSQLIARSETNWAQNVSSLAYYREAPEVDTVMAMDGSDDPECAERNGQVYSVDEAEQELENEHPNGTLCFAPMVSSDQLDEALV